MKNAALCATLSIVMLFTGGRSQAAAAQQSPVADPLLETRVSVSYTNAQASDVLGTLAKAVGLTLDMNTKPGPYTNTYANPGPLMPVTITLTNVKLRTALDAVCQNASCWWELQSRDYSSRSNDTRRINVLMVTPQDRAYARALPSTVSLKLRDTPIISVFAALATALNVRMVLSSDLPDNIANFDLENADTTGVLRLLCDLGKCSWDFDPNTSILRIVAKP